MNKELGYYIVLTSEILLSKDLKDSEKILLGVISGLQKKSGWCYASNKFLSELTNTSLNTVANRISKLVKLGYLDRKIIYKNNSKEIEKRYLKIVFKSEDLLTENKGAINLQVNTPLNPQVKDNKINNINNNIVEIIQYLNHKIGTKYKESTSKTRTLIKARLNEGFTVEDFKTVIDKKTKDWINDTKMCKYLRPETLFGTKFETYLNEKKYTNDTYINKRKYAAPTGVML